MAVYRNNVHGLSSTLREDKGGSVTVRGRYPTQGGRSDFTWEALNKYPIRASSTFSACFLQPGGRALLFRAGLSPGFAGWRSIACVAGGLIPWLRTSDDSSGDRPRSGAAWPDLGGAPNHDDVQLLGGLALYATYLYASRLGANRVYDHANGLHASIGRHGQATALAACRPYWPRSAKGCRQLGPEPERLQLQLRKQGLRSSTVLLMPTSLPRTRTGRRAPSVGHGIS